MTVVVSVATLFAKFWSAVCEGERGVEESAWRPAVTTIVMVALSPIFEAARVAHQHVRVKHSPWLGVAETSVTPAGRCRKRHLGEIRSVVGDGDGCTSAACRGRLDPAASDIVSDTSASPTGNGGQREPCRRIRRR